MPKNARRNLFKTAIIAFSVVALIAADMAQAQAQNPWDGTFMVRYVRNGVMHIDEVTIPNWLWSSCHNPWNGRYTEHECLPFTGHIGRQRIENGDTDLTFPVGVNNITAAEVNAYWDFYFLGSPRIGEPTWEYNCHGHSTGLRYWIQPHGLLVLLSLDWIPCTSWNDETPRRMHVLSHFSTGHFRDHSVKITGLLQGGGIFGETIVTEVTEKVGPAGTYRHTYFPNAAPVGLWGTFRPR